jgi:pimeloyl-ACP methyl ester carboxylesterase
VPDARVQAAVDNWAARFVANGVDFNDFQRTTARIERWDEWLDAWVETGNEHRALAEEADSELSAGEAWVRAAVAYHFAKFVWVVDVERNRQTTRLAVDAMARAHGALDPTARRLEVAFDGATLVANLRRPVNVGTPPLVVLVAGLDSTKEEFFHWENVFLARGMATLSLDGPGQGESGFELSIRPDYEEPLSAVLDAVAWDGPVGAVGVSLGGYYAPRAAAREPRVRAVAGISGPYNFGECWDGLPALTRETFRHHSGARSEDEARAKAHELDLAGVIGELEQPVLIVTGKRDAIIPWEESEQVAREAQDARFVLYEEGTHVCNNMPYRYRPLVGDWMRNELEHVG